MSPIVPEIIWQKVYHWLWYVCKKRNGEGRLPFQNSLLSYSYKGITHFVFGCLTAFIGRNEIFFDAASFL